MFWFAIGVNVINIFVKEYLYKHELAFTNSLIILLLNYVSRCLFWWVFMDWLTGDAPTFEGWTGMKSVMLYVGCYYCIKRVFRGGWD